MEPSGFEPLTPCMPWSLFISWDLLQRNGFIGLLHCILRQIVSQNREKVMVVKQELDGHRKSAP